MNTVTVTLSKEEQLALKNRYPEAKECKTPPYANYQIKLSDCTITAYTSGKVVFQGESAEYHSSFYTKNEVKQKISSQIFPQCGSDEVGTGDYFGPVVVCACYVDETLYKEISSLNIMDSKQLKDEEILKIAPVLIEKLPHSKLIVNNKKYNEVHDLYNMNAIKAKLHNAAYVQLEKKLNQLPAFKIIDQFTPEKSYYTYLKNEKPIINNIHFETKAENKYISVACASIIARYAFLKEMSAMENLYHMNFPKGAGTAVDNSAKLFIQIHGLEKLKEVAKVHFANTRKMILFKNHFINDKH